MVGISATRERGTAPRLLGLQMWRAGAALLVALYHLATTPDRRWAQTAGHANWLAEFGAIGFAGVDLFFVISGVVMTVTSWHHLGDPREAVPFLKRRVARIYPLYWLCCAAVLALAWVDPGLTSRGKIDLAAVVESVLLWPQHSFPIVGVGWTLSYEMFFYIVFALFFLLPRTRVLSVLGLWLVSVVVLFRRFNDPANLAIVGNLQLPLVASPLVLEFIAGCGIGLLLCRGELPLPRTALVAGAAWFFGVGSFFGATDYDDAAYGMMRIWVFGVPSALLIYGTVGLEQANRLWTSRRLVFWGDASYSLYLTHVYVIQAFGLLYAHWSFVQGGPPKALLAATCLATCGLVAAACHRWVDRPLTTAARRLLDGRSADARALAGR